MLMKAWSLILRHHRVGGIGLFQNVRCFGLTVVMFGLVSFVVECMSKVVVAANTQSMMNCSERITGGGLDIIILLTQFKRSLTLARELAKTCLF